MGLYFAKAISSLTGQPRSTRIVMVGLDAAGKTTILYKLKLADVVTTIPTIANKSCVFACWATGLLVTTDEWQGFNVETVEYKNVNFTVWDIGGQDKIRPLWAHYYANTQGIIYVVDSNDRSRLEEAAAELHKMLEESELAGAALLVLANKQDLPQAMNATEITEGLRLSEIKARKWYIQACCATSGDGLYEGLDWLSASLAA